jgi:hypothetical protein
MGWSLEKHLAEPTINAGYSAAAKELARAVAKALKGEAKPHSAICACGHPRLKHLARGECVGPGCSCGSFTAADEQWDGTGHG